MRTNYSPSVNIIRDSEQDFHYLPTPNAKKVVNQLVDDFKKGIRSFNIIGTYGTGKSSFLLALEHSLRKVKPYFDVNFVQDAKFDTLKIVGSYRSLIETFKQTLEIEDTEMFLEERIFSEIYNRYHALGKKSRLLIISLDEFGKFLEYAATNNPEKELYFIQQLAEFVNNPKYNIILITTIHQSFESYGFGLSGALRQEWSKVKGRFREITFNEPVEQLLFLASEFIGENVDKKGVSEKEYKHLFHLFKESRAFTFSEAYVEAIATKLFPLDLFAAYTLTLALQRYGQNERSLFSFLEGTDHTSLSRFIPHESKFYNLANVYDYLSFNFYNFLNSPYNPDFGSWSSIKTSIERAEAAFSANLGAITKLLKTIGLLNAFGSSGARLTKEIVVNYAESCLGVKNAEAILQQLEAKKIILYREYNTRYVLFEGTDLNIQSALIEAANKVSDITYVKTLLQRYYNLPPVLAKEYSYETGTPRYFQYIISEEPIQQVPQGEIDGFINLIFSDKLLTLKSVAEASAAQKEAIIYVYYRNSREIKSLLFEIEKTQKVLEENLDDRVARKELENIILHKRNLLNHYILNNLVGKGREVVWHWGGTEWKVPSKRAFNNLLSEVCRTVYSKTPVFKNELVNKNKLSTPISVAKKNLFKAISDDWDKEDLGFEKGKFPPEKMIYLTLLKGNKLDTFSGENLDFKGVSKSAIGSVWQESLRFLDRSKGERKSVRQLVESLQAAPFKLKQGLIDFWVPIFLFIKRNDLSLFSEHGFIPEINSDIMDLLSRNPQNFWVKAIDVEGVKLDIFNSYRHFLSQEKEESVFNKTFIETIKPFITFYKKLPQYSKHTQRLSKEALDIRTAVSTAVDPEKTFFEDFPAALGTSIDRLKSKGGDLQGYIETLQNAIRELRTAYDKLIERLEDFIRSEIVYQQLDFEDYKGQLQERYQKLKKHLLLPSQRIFVQRLYSVIDDKKPWLSSLTQATIGKTLEDLRDEDEVLLYEKLKGMFLSLDNLTQLSAADIDESQEEVLGVQFDSFVDGVKKSLIRVPKTQEKEVERVKKELSGKLSKDRLLNIAALAKLLKEMVNNE